MEKSLSFTENRFKNINTKIDESRIKKTWTRNTIENLEDLKEELQLPEDMETTNKMIEILKSRLLSL